MFRINIIGVKELRIPEQALICKLVTKTSTFATEPTEIASWKTSFELKLETMDENVIFEIWNRKKKLGSLVLSVAGYSDINFDQAKDHWYQVSDIKKIKFGMLGLRMGKIDTKITKPISIDHNMELEDILTLGSNLVADSNASLHRSTRMAGNIIEIGEVTNARLATQNAKLERSSQLNTQITEDLTEAKRELRSIRSVTGQMLNSVTSSSYKHEALPKVNKHISNAKLESSSSRTSDPIDYSMFSDTTQTQIVDNDYLIDGLDHSIKQIKTASLMMQEALDNKIVDTVQQQTSKNTQQMKKVRHAVKKA